MSAMSFLLRCAILLRVYQCKAWELPLKKDVREWIRPFVCGEENQCFGCEICDDMCRFYNNSCCGMRSQTLVPNLEEWQYKCMRIYPDMDMYLPIDCFPNITVYDQFDILGVLMVTKCSTKWQDSIYQRYCEEISGSLLSKIPVYENDKDFITYRNVHCALCNDVSLDKIQFWETEIQCNYTDYVNVLTNFDDKHCVTFLLPTSKRPKYRMCSTKMINTCPEFYESDLSIIDMKSRCENGQTGPIFIGDNFKSYKNEDCWMCNHFNLTESVIRNSIGLDFFSYDFIKHGRCRRLNPCHDSDIPSYSLKRLVNLNFDDKNYVLNDLKYHEKLIDQSDNAPCRAFDENCKNEVCIYMEISEKLVSVNDTSVNIKQLNIFVPKERFYRNGTKTFVCLYANQRAQLMQTEHESEKGDVIEKVLTFVSLIASITCMCVTLWLYLCLRSLRNTHGKIMLNLIVSLFFAQLSFLVSFSFRNINFACVLSGVLTHYLFLVSFCSMNAVGLHFYRAFSNLLAERTRNNQVLTSVIYSWAMPLLILITALIVDYAPLPSNMNAFRPHYGNGSCWINSSKALLTFFIIPLAFFKFVDIWFYSNTAFFIARGIRKGSELNSTINRSQNRCTFCINLKLSLIMGLSWLFSFLANPVDHSFLWYLFIVCNSLQGLFIFLSVTCTRNVWSLLCYNKQKHQNIKKK